MVWLAILALAIWLLVEHNRASSLAREVETLRRRLAGEPAQPPTAATPPPVRTPGEITPAMDVAARAAAERAPVATIAAARITAPETAPRPRAPAPPPAPLITRAMMETWLAEKGLAWIGGSALVIGGAFLVGYAAQRGLFGPPMRIAAACLLGLALLGVGEAIRRGRLAGFGGHKLAAAIISGAGAAVLYGAAWAAYGLYGFIDGLLCAGILIGVSAGLLGLAFVHGEALALLALGGAYLTPLVAGRREWTIEALTIYMAILVASGAVIAWIRRWPIAAWANLAGVGVWALLSVFKQETLKSLLLGLEPLAVTAALAYARPRQMPGRVGTGAVIVASAATFFALSIADAGAHPMTEGLIAAFALPLLTAALQRRGHASAWALAGPGLAFTLAALMARMGGLATLTLTELWCVQVLALNGAGLWAAARGGKDMMAAGSAGAIGSLALGLVAGGGFGAGAYAPLAPGVACLSLALGAYRLTRTRPLDQQALEIWGGASAAALLAAIAVGFSWRWGALGFAAASLGLALAGRRLNWRSVSLAAAVGGGLAFGALLTPSMTTYALSGQAGAAFILGVGAAVAVASFFAARLAAREPVAAETLRTLSPLAALVGAFVFLRWMAGAKTGLPLDDLTEASIRTLLIAVAGLASLARISAERSAFARWRGHVLMIAAALHGILLQGLVFNPRLGIFGDVEGGVIFLNVLAAAYLAPALVFALASARAYPSNRPTGAGYAVVSLFFGLTWVFLEIRRFFHGPHLGGDALTIGVGEALADSLVLLAIAAMAGRLRPGGPADPFREHVGRIHGLIRWVAVGFTLVMAGWWSNPCWGPAAAPLDGASALAGVLAGYALVVLLTARLALDARRVGAAIQAEIAAVSSVLMGVILASLAARAVFHGTDLTLRSPTGQLETWSYSAVWAAIGLAFIGVSRRGGQIFRRTGVALLLAAAAKVFIVDTASLSGVVRAGSFLALGVLLLAGALTARRIAQASAPAAPETEAAPESPG